LSKKQEARSKRQEARGKKQEAIRLYGITKKIPLRNFGAGFLLSNGK